MKRILAKSKYKGRVSISWYFFYSFVDVIYYNVLKLFESFVFNKFAIDTLHGWNKTKS